MKKATIFIILAAVAPLAGCARHHHSRLDFAQVMDILLFDQDSQFRTFFV